MRLIDADVLMKEIEQSKNHNTHKDLARKLNHDSEHLHFMRMVSNQPTAFDKEQVIEKLKHIENDTFNYYNRYDDEVAFGESSAFRSAIEIIEKGGIE